jgi:hypothetical protein
MSRVAESIHAWSGSGEDEEVKASVPHVWRWGSLRLSQLERGPEKSKMRQISRGNTETVV